jgi:hypothetical protein
MTDAPERIWAFPPEIFDNMSVWQLDKPSGKPNGAEYIRADIAKAEKVRAKALEEAALECDAIAARRKGTDRGYAAEDCASNIRALKSIRSGDAISKEEE